jgi:hypothetical protein
MKTFAEGTNELLVLVGAGDLEGRIVVDQIYAQNQHESVWFKHPAGGKAKYLSEPLLSSAPRMLQHLANHVLHGSLVDAMADNMEHMSKEVYDNAPWEFADLRASGHPLVSENGSVVYDRPPAMHRLTPSELKAKDDLRALGLGHN